MDEPTLRPTTKENLNPRSIAKEKSAKYDKTLDSHFLAARSLTKRKTASLLLSASFGANALLYATFLGYLMGLWALIIQIAWAISFFLLAKFSNQVYNSTSLHEFLGVKFGKSTRWIAAACSIVGITYFTGWEIAIARISLESLTTVTALSSTWLTIAICLLITVIVAALVYTVIWGRKASGMVNLVLNSIKIGCLVMLTAILLGSRLADNQITGSLLLPSFSAAIIGLGVVGFITNILFNLSWQFVDNSTWQSVSSGRAKNVADTVKTIRLAGITTLLTVNGLGTILGTLLRGNSLVDSNNVLGYVVQMSTHLKVVSLCLMIILLAFSAMSLFDGAILSVTQSIIVDLKSRWMTAKRITLTHARIATFIIGVIAAWGVTLIIKALGSSIFNFVYVVIIVQLSLAGPVLVGLIAKRKAQTMWLAIVVSLIAGIIVTIYGTANDNQNLIQGAGTITAALSISLAFIIYAITKKKY